MTLKPINYEKMSEIMSGLMSELKNVRYIG